MRNWNKKIKLGYMAAALALLVLIILRNPTITAQVAENLSNITQVNTPPIWKSEIDTLIIKGKTTINLNDYFFDENNDSISYSFTEPNGFLVEANNNLITLTPKAYNLTSDFEITASDGSSESKKIITLTAPEKKIDLKLEYKSDSEFDTDNNGNEPVTGVIDLTVENSAFSWDADESKLCTRWQIHSIESDEFTSICYGSTKCCNFIELEPAKDKWNDALYLTLGYYGATLNNDVNAQIIYVDYSLDVEKPYSDIQYSSLASLKANYYYDFIDFKDVCIDTCLITDFNDTSIKIIIEINNTVLNLDLVSYLIKKTQKLPFSLGVKDSESGISGTYELRKQNLPVFIDNNQVEPNNYTIYVEPKDSLIKELVIKDVEVTKPIKAEIGIDNVKKQINIPNLTAKKAYAVDLEDLTFKNAILRANATASVLYKCKQWDFEREVCFGSWEKVKDLVAGQEYELELSSQDPAFVEGDVIEVKHDIIEEKVTKGKVVVGQPVKWTKRVKFAEEKSNIAVNISPEAEDIVVKKIIDNINVEIPKEKIKVKVNDTIKKLEEYELEKEIEKLEKEAEIKKEKNSITGAVSFNIKLNNWLKKFLGSITGYVVSGENKEESTEIILQEPVEELLIEYITEGPKAEETNISENKKQIVITSDIHYENITAFTYLPREASAQFVKLYWILNDSKIEVDVDKYDTNENSLIDYIEWIVPSLSNQTYELQIIVLNVQSYPTVGGNWTVRFNTTGTGNLSIYGYDGTTYAEVPDDSSTINDLEYLETRCNDVVLNTTIVCANGEQMPYEVYKLKKRIAEIKKRLQELNQTG